MILPCTRPLSASACGIRSEIGAEPWLRKRVGRSAQRPRRRLQKRPPAGRAPHGRERRKPAPRRRPRRGRTAAARKTAARKAPAKRAAAKKPAAKRAAAKKPAAKRAAAPKKKASGEEAGQRQRRRNRPRPRRRSRPRPAAPQAAPRPCAPAFDGIVHAAAPCRSHGRRWHAARPAGGTATPGPSTGGGMPGSSPSPSAQPYRPSWARDDDDM